MVEPQSLFNCFHRMHQAATTVIHIWKTNSPEVGISSLNKSIAEEEHSNSFTIIEVNSKFLIIFFFKRQNLLPHELRYPRNAVKSADR